MLPGRCHSCPWRSCLFSACSRLTAAVLPFSLSQTQYPLFCSCVLQACARLPRASGPQCLSFFHAGITNSTCTPSLCVFKSLSPNFVTLCHPKDLPWWPFLMSYLAPLGPFQTSVQPTPCSVLHRTAHPTQCGSGPIAFSELPSLPCTRDFSLFCSPHA